jgi:hypothetical protein
MPNKLRTDIMNKDGLIREALAIGRIKYTGRGTKMILDVYYVGLVKRWFAQENIPRTGYWEEFFERLDREIVVGSRVNKFLWDLRYEMRYEGKVFV